MAGAGNDIPTQPQRRQHGFCLGSVGAMLPGPRVGLLNRGDLTVVNGTKLDKEVAVEAKSPCAQDAIRPKFGYKTSMQARRVCG
jgi:hypothetical protein